MSLHGTEPVSRPVFMKDCEMYQIEAGVWPSKKPGQGRSGSLGPRSIFRESGFGSRRWWQEGSVRFGEDIKMALMFGAACMYLVQTP